MTMKELHVFFKEHLVPERLYNLKGNHKNRICMEKVQDGFDVFFSDHKNKVGLSHYSSESDACLYMKEEMRKVMEQLYGVTWSMA